MVTIPVPGGSVDQVTSYTCFSYINTDKQGSKAILDPQVLTKSLNCDTAFAVVVAWLAS